MPLLHIVILALVQGITEFLPISSSGHLILTWEAFDAMAWPVPEQSHSERLIIDVAVHVGTLFAVMAYFWRDLLEMIAGIVRSAAGKRDPGGRLAFHVVLATIPVVIAGFLLKDTVTLYLRDPTVIAGTTIGFGLLLFLGDRSGLTIRRLEHMSLGAVMTIGLAQVLALVPGTSRAGITMTAARFLGYERQEAARFSLLLAIPAILGAGTLAGLDLYESGNLRLGLDAALAAGLSFLAALAAIAAMMGWLRKATFTPFVLYRVLLGAGLLYLIYGG